MKRDTDFSNTVRPLLIILLAAAIVWSIATVPGWAQDPTPVPNASPETEPVDKAGLHQALLDLTNPWTVMCVAAHPDDEDGTTLTVLRRRDGVHTVSLFSTYGEGGQNAVGPQLYEELGVIRAKETKHAAEIQGSEPYFLGLKDFGFSKSADEAFRVWGHDEALRRMVLKIRELRPDVIITNHDTTHGHGHHQATGRLIIEAFDAAADAKRFPEQLSQVKPWQAQRLFVRLFGGPGGSDTPKDSAPIVEVDPNEMDAVGGSSFAEQALEALKQHASQGPWPNTIADMMRARRLEGGKLPPIRYRLERHASQTPEMPQHPSNFFEGLKPPASVPDADAFSIRGKMLPELADQPAQALDALIKWRVETTADDASEEPLADARVNNALAQAAAISLSISSNDPVLIRGQKTNFTITVANGGSKPLQISKLTFIGWGRESTVEIPDHLLHDTEATANVESLTPLTATFTVPQANHLYDGMLFGAPFKAVADIDMEGARFRVSTETRVDVAPAVEITAISPSPCVRTEETLGGCRELESTLANHTSAAFRGNIKTRIDRDSLSREVARPLVMRAGETAKEQILTSNKIPRPADLRGLRRSRSAVVSVYGSGNELIDERNVQLVYSAAQVRPDLHVAYVASFDQTLEHSLAALGVESKAFSAGDIQNADLSSYQTVILDNRAYEAHPELIAANSHLLEFVHNGGTMIVLYHKSNEWNPDPNKQRPQLAPYPIILGDDRVTDETAAVNFLLPRHALLNSPNRINAADFQDWVQERGLYYPKEWDSHYTALFSMMDKGEKPLRGGLLVGRYGKGNYIYTSMVWYRQLRAGLPGAYRILANMISYR